MYYTVPGDLLQCAKNYFRSKSHRPDLAVTQATTAGDTPGTVTLSVKPLAPRKASSWYNHGREGSRTWQNLREFLLGLPYSTVHLHRYFLGNPVAGGI